MLGMKISLFCLDIERGKWLVGWLSRGVAGQRRISA